MIQKPENRQSLSAKFRAKRAGFLSNLLELNSLKSLKLLDVGGTESYWELNLPYIKNGLIESIDIVNLPPIEPSSKKLHGVQCEIYGANALDLTSLRLGKYDFVFSNSVIEHVGALRDQKVMAESISKLADFYLVQTPSYSFPIEPHFYFPLFHVLPLCLRSMLHRNFNLGFMSKENDYLESRIACEETRLLRKRELQEVFPEATLISEKVGPLVKSWMATNLK